MATPWREDLADLLGVPGVSGELPIHPAFEDHRRTVEDLCQYGDEELFENGYRQIGRYGEGPLLSLRERCREHAAAHAPAGDLLGSDTLVLVHPFFPLLKHWPLIDGDSRKQLATERYLSRVFLHVVADRSPREQIVLFESPESYAIAGAWLAERGCFDAIVFTKFNKGHTIDDWEAPIGPASDIRIAGCYEGRCVGQASDEIAGLRRKVGNYDDRRWLSAPWTPVQVEGLVLSPPN